MRTEQIVVGMSYVNEDAGVVREVVEELDARRVRVNTFDLTTGKLEPTRHNVWHRSRLAQWADREARPPEMARVHPYEPEVRSDLPFTPERPDASLERARAAIDAAPGHHTFPRAK